MKKAILFSALFLLAGCAVMTQNYLRVHSLRRVAIVSCNANPTINEPQDNSESKGFSLGDIQSGLKAVSQVADGKSLSEALDSSDHNMNGVNTLVAGDVTATVAGLGIFGVIPQKEVVDNPAYQAYKPPSRGSKSLIAPAGWRVYSNYDINPGCTLASKLNADAILVLGNSYSWKKAGGQLIGIKVRGSVAVSAYLVSPTGEVLWSRVTSKDSDADIGMISGAYDWEAMNDLLRQAAGKAYQEIFKDLKREVDDAVKKGGPGALPSVSSDTTAPEDTLESADTLGTVTDTAAGNDSASALAPAGKPDTAAAVKTAQPQPAVAAKDSTAVRTDSSAAPVDSSAISSSRSAIYLHPLTLLIGQWVTAIDLPQGVFLTYEVMRPRGGSIILRPGYIIKDTYYVGTDSIGEINKTLNGLDLQLGVRRYFSRRFAGSFYELMGNLGFLNVRYEDKVNGGLVDDAKTSLLKIGAAGYLGWTKITGRSAWYFDVGMGYAFYLPNDTPLLIQNGTLERRIDPTMNGAFLDFNFGMGIPLH
jgi:hypothetical protein